MTGTGLVSHMFLLLPTVTLSRVTVGDQSGRTFSACGPFWP